MRFKNKIISFIKQADGNVIFLINLKKNYDNLYSFLERLLKESPSGHLLVFFNIKKPCAFSKTDLNIKLSEYFLSKEDYNAIDDYIFNHLSVSWYLYRNVPSYNNIQLGNIIEYEFQKYLTPRIKNIEIILKISAEKKINKMIVIDDTGELIDAARLFGSHFKIPVLEVYFWEKKGVSSLLSALRLKTVSLFCNILDRYALNKIVNDHQKEETILIDSRLHNYFEGRIHSIKLVPVLLEKGLRLRINLLKKGQRYLPLHVFSTKNGGQRRRIHQEAFSALCLDNNFMQFFRYKNISIWNMLFNRLSSIFLADFSRISANIDLLMNLFNKSKIRLVLLRNDSKEVEKTMIYASRLFNVPSLVVQNGILALENGHNIVVADKVAVWGQASIERYTKFGNDIEKFEITGNPRFDILANWKPRFSREELCKQLNLNENKGITLFVTQQINKFSSFWTDDLFLVMADELLKAMQHFPDKQLIVKVDPYEDVNLYRNRIKGSPYNNTVAVRDIDIYTLISLSELVITLDSTVTLEAMIFDKPVITFNLTKRPDRVPYAVKGAAIAVYEDENLVPAIEKALTDQETILKLKIGRSVFLEEYAYKIDGKANERISSLLKHYIEN